MRFASEARQLVGVAVTSPSLVMHIELHRALDLLRIGSVSFALIAFAGLACRALAQHRERDRHLRSVFRSLMCT